MLSKFTESPLTLGGGILCLVGLLILVIGLWAEKDTIWQAGMAMIGSGGTLIGLFARDNTTSNRAHLEDRQYQAQTRQAAIQRIDEQIESVKIEAVDTAAQVAEVTAQAKAAETAKVVATQVVTDEVRKSL